MTTLARVFVSPTGEYVLQHLSSRDGHLVVAEVHDGAGAMLGTIDARGTLRLTALDEDGNLVTLAPPERVHAVLHHSGVALGGEDALAVLHACGV